MYARLREGGTGYRLDMANTDDLDEYDAELELRLKREYIDVFPIFRFCVITEEATYLCNELRMDCVPHGSYILFEVEMSDVWVWDRNRPTRIIPRAHVFTTGDVTVEQLRGDEGELQEAVPAGVLEQLRTQLVVEGAGPEDEVGGGPNDETQAGPAIDSGELDPDAQPDSDDDSEAPPAAP